MFRPLLLGIALAGPLAVEAFAPPIGSRTTTTTTIPPLYGYLDDLSKDLQGEDPNPDLVAESKEATDMSKDQIDRYGPGNLNQFVDFHEFDGGDGREYHPNLCVVVCAGCYEFELTLLYNGARVSNNSQ